MDATFTLTVRRANGNYTTTPFDSVIDATDAYTRAVVVMLPGQSVTLTQTTTITLGNASKAGTPTIDYDDGLGGMYA